MMLTPGVVPLGAWRDILGGAAIPLDPASRAAVDRGAAAVTRVIEAGETAYGVNTGFGKLASVRIGDGDLATLQRNLILSHACGVGAPLPGNIVRLIMAMKAASLARGASGVRWEVIALIEAMRTRDVLPVIPAKGSVGASGDLAPLAHLTAAMLGEGQVLPGMPAVAALRDAGLAPITLGPKEGLGLINGTQVSTSIALAGLFATERVFQAALMTGAMTVDALRGSDTPFDARIHALRGHAGQAEVAEALRGLLAGSAIRESHRFGDDRVQDPYSLRCQPQVMGAVLDMLRFAARTLETEANAVTDYLYSPGDTATKVIVAKPAYVYLGFETTADDASKERLITTMPSRVTAPESNRNEEDLASREFTCNIFPNTAKELFHRLVAA